MTVTYAEAIRFFGDRDAMQRAFATTRQSVWRWQVCGKLPPIRSYEFRAMQARRKRA